MRFLIKMKKNLLALLSIATIIIAGCIDTEVIKINPENWISDE
jgi:hypothetical protein